MNKTDRMILKIFLLGLPVVFVVSVICSLIDTSKLQQGAWGIYNGFAGFVFAAWMIFAIYLSLRLLFSKELRGQILPRLSFFKERDERELLMTARATRNSFLTTLALLIFLLCLSVFQVAVYRVPPEQAVNGKSGFISLGANLTLSNLEGTAKEATPLDLFRYSGLPLSNTAMVFLLMAWLLGSYNYFMRKIAREGADFLEA